MTGPDNVVPLPRPAADKLQDRINLASGILGHRPWCNHCLRHAADVLAALCGVTLAELTQRRMVTGPGTTGCGER
jgi:hypothetical protein